MNFDIVVKAGLTNSEFATIVGVSNVMVWKWVSGKAEPRDVYKGKPLRKRVEILLATLTKLVDKGQLPKNDTKINRFSDDATRARRASMIAKITQFLDAQVASAPANE
jgi:predicted transcriptional regulator